MKDETTKKANKALTAKEKMFCLCYVECGFNATEAARKAGYSEKTARQIGYENLTKPYIKEEVERIKKEKVEEMGLNSNRILYELGKDLQVDPTQLLEGNTVRGFIMKSDQVQELPKELRQAVKKITSNVQGEAIVEFYDRRKGALEMLAKYTNLFDQHNKSKTPKGLPVVLNFNNKPEQESED